MQTQWNENQARLIGEALQEPQYSHVSHGEDYFVFPLRSVRLSGTEDVINVTISRSLLELCPVHVADRIAVVGEVRSFNNHSGVGRKLVINLFARMICPAELEEDTNQVMLAGSLCKVPIYRRTPMGREIADLLLAVNRRYGRADYLPCIAWGSLAQRCAALSVGDGIAIKGRLQSRDYTKVTEAGQEVRTAYEVSIMSMETMGRSETAQQKTE